MLVRLDDDGWSVMSARCSHEGCDLTFQPNTFLCSCCRSVYDHDGAVLKGPAVHALPYYELTFKHDKLQANTEKIVQKNYRFMMPEIKDLVKELRRRVLEEGKGQVRIPKVLLGQEQGQIGSQFQVQSDDRLYELEMEQWEKENL